jgi:glutamate dehydrogenase/leucine dehydrogenase
MLATKVVDNAYDVALENFDAAADALGLDNDTREMIKYPERVLTVSVPVRMDDGTIKRFQGYRVQHSTARGPAKGGIRRIVRRRMYTRIRRRWPGSWIPTA